jgi:hypothetical protein
MKRESNIATGAGGGIKISRFSSDPAVKISPNQLTSTDEQQPWRIWFVERDGCMEELDNRDIAPQCARDWLFQTGRVLHGARLHSEGHSNFRLKTHRIPHHFDLHKVSGDLLAFSEYLHA